jgi:hypothetical protein
MYVGVHMFVYLQYTYSVLFPKLSEAGLFRGNASVELTTHMRGTIVEAVFSLLYWTLPKAHTKEVFKAMILLLLQGSRAPVNWKGVCLDICQVCMYVCMYVHMYIHACVYVGMCISL